MGITLLVSPAFADVASIGRDGIDSSSLMLSGAGIGIGMVDAGRPGKVGVDDAMHSDMTIDPEEVYVGTAMPVQNQGVDDHGQIVAGVMIGTDLAGEGVATEANLYASALAPGNFQQQSAIALQHIANRQGGAIAAINISYGLTLGSDMTDGSSLLTQYIDWSSRVHDTLYVQSADEMTPTIPSSPIPKDDYNGVTVGASLKIGDVFRKVADFNFYGGDADGARTSVDILAPGEDIFSLNAAGNLVSADGTSVAAPHVTGTVALLQEYAEARIIDTGGPLWKPAPNANARRHEVMKAVLMNSADKLEDTGDGMRLGMSRTVLKKDGSNWLTTDAYTERGIPLDLEMGAGHLNARRALQQFSSGEIDATVPAGTVVPQIGWDYANTGDTGSFVNEYVFEDPLPAGSFVSITLAWDRIVNLDMDAGTTGEYDVNDTFESVGFNDLDIYLLPQGSTTIDDAVWSSISADSNLEHLFFQIQTTDMYEFWAYEFDSPIQLGTDYAIAWWAFNGPTGTAGTGDYNGDTIVDSEDYDLWRASFGSTTNLAADGNGNQVIDAADYVVWRDTLGATLGAGTAAVPEPSSVMLLAFACAFAVLQGQLRSR
ncbi:MAG: S8 family serine peptidase [Pirellulales bacterium]